MRKENALKVISLLLFSIFPNFNAEILETSRQQIKVWKSFLRNFCFCLSDFNTRACKRDEVILLNISHSTLPHSCIISPSAIVSQYIRDFINILDIRLVWYELLCSSPIINNVWYSIKFIKKFLSRSTSSSFFRGLFSFLVSLCKDWMRRHAWRGTMICLIYLHSQSLTMMSKLKRKIRETLASVYRNIL